MTVAEACGLDQFRPLLPAEEYVVANLSSGDFDRLGDGSRPAVQDPSRAVRAKLLRFLLLGGDDGCRPHEKGVRLSGAWVTGTLDLESCRIRHDIGLNNCHFESAPVLRSAIIERLFMDGSFLPGLQAERLDARGGLYLRGTEIVGQVRLGNSRFGGNVDCDGVVVREGAGVAFDAEGIEVRNVLLRGATLRGGLNLEGARIGADLNLAGAEIHRESALAVNATAIELGASLSLHGSRIAGEVRLLRAWIGGDLDCSGARLSNPGQDALQMSRAFVTGGFFLRDAAQVDGTLIMTGASIGTVHDEPASWPRHGDLLLNRCLYSAFVDGPVDARSRLDWLSRQCPERWNEDFWPQPYEQLASVFREMGHGEDARAVLIRKERLQRRARQQRASNPISRWVLGVVDNFLRVTVSYGHQPLLAFVWLGLFWGLGVVVFTTAEWNGAIKPNNPLTLRTPEWTLCSLPPSEQRQVVGSPQPQSGRARPGQTQLDCFRGQFEASGYPKFNAWMYALDTLLPVLEMGQKTYWRPNPSEPFGAYALTYYYLQSVVGWALSLLAVAGFSGLVKSH